jgi:hypothetical protein
MCAMRKHVLLLGLLVAAQFVTAQETSSTASASPAAANTAATGPRVCEWKPDGPGSSEKPGKGGDMVRSIECGDFIFTAVIAQTDAFDLTTRKGFNMPITFVNLTVINRGTAPITADFKQFEMVRANGKKVKPTTPLELSNRIEKGDMGDPTNEANMNRNVYNNTGSTATAANQAYWRKQAKYVRDMSLVDKTIAPNGEEVGFVFFPAEKKPGYTIRWNAPNGDVLVLTAAEWKH